MSYSTVVRCYNRCNELLESTILDSSTRSGATRKANGWLRETFFRPMKKFDIDNYQYWNCYDAADIEMGRLDNALNQ